MGHKKLEFYQWKSKQIKIDGFIRDRYWYYQEYGNYCKKFQ